jgi:DNA-binding transcriptional LysR family regulator
VDIKKLKHFVEIANTGSFNQAAEKLHISQPALTRSIQALERSLGLGLFDRSQRYIKLTAAGQRLLQHAQKSLLEVENLAEQARRLKTLQAGLLSVGIGPLPADTIGAKACGQFLHRYPNIKLSMVVDDPATLTHRLISGAIDVMIVDERTIKDQSEFSFQPLRSQPAVAVARSEHPLAGVLNVGRESFIEYPLATISYLAEDIVAKALGVKPAEIFTYNCNSVSLLLKTLEHCDAIGFLLASHILPDVSAGKHVVIDFKGFNEKVRSKVGICTYLPRLNSLALDAFIAIVKEVDSEPVEPSN